MSKSRDERYATAQELADDLRRFLDGKPTSCQTTHDRQVEPRSGSAATRSSLRFVAVLMVAVLGLLASTGMLARQKRETEIALAEAEDQLPTVSNAARIISQSSRVVARPAWEHTIGHELRLKRRSSFSGRCSRSGRTMKRHFAVWQ